MRVEGGKLEKKVKMIEAKDLKPSTLKKKEDWKVWQERTMRDGEAVHKGMEEVLKKWKDHKEAIEEKDMDEVWWEKRSELWTYLEEYTDGDAQKLVKCVKLQNGWEAWRRLNKHFEAGVAAREAGVRQAFGNMNNKKSKNSGEAQSPMVELEEMRKSTWR